MQTNPKITIDRDLVDRAVLALANLRNLTYEDAHALIRNNLEALDGKGESVEVVKGTEDTAYQYSGQS